MGSNLNTDNAWVENYVVIYHDALGNVFSDIPLNVNIFKSFIKKKKIIICEFKQKASDNNTIFKWAELNEKAVSSFDIESAKYYGKVMKIASKYIS
jgi:hypothetical protein